MTRIARFDRPAFWIAAFTCFAAAGAACAGEKEPFGRITVAEVERRLGEKGFYVFDNNPLDVYEAGHVPGAKWVDYRHVQARDLPRDQSATLVFYCANEH